MYAEYDSPLLRECLSEALDGKQSDLGLGLMSHSRDKLSVMQAILTLERGGAQEAVRTLAEYLEANGCSVTVCAFADGPMRTEIENLGVKVEILKRPRYGVVLLPMYVAEMLRIRRDLARLIDQYQVDVLQTHLLQVLDFLALSLRHGTRLRIVVWTMHNVEFFPEWVEEQERWFQNLKRALYRVLYRLLARQVDGIVAVSHEVRQAVLKQMGPVEDKVFAVCNAVDLRSFAGQGDRAALCSELGLESDSQLIGTVGRLTEQKGHRYLIDAANSVVSSHPDTHFLFIGDGELKKELHLRAQRSGLSGHVHFLGVRQDVPDLLAAIDLFVLPSLWEGLSVALLEAMASGRAVVTTAVSGTAEAVIPGQTGLVVPPGNGQALAEAIIQLLSNPVQAQAMGQAGRQHVETHFDPQKQAREHLALYGRLLERRPALSLR